MTSNTPTTPGQEPAEHPDHSGDQPDPAGGPCRGDRSGTPDDGGGDPGDYAARVSAGRANAKRKRTGRAGTARPEQDYAAWAKAVADEVPAGWIDAEEGLPEEIRAMRALSAQLPGPGLAAKTAAIEADGVDDEVLLEMIKANHRLSAWMSAQQAELVTQFSQRREGQASAPYVVSELAAHLALTGYGADKLCARAQSLAEYPELAEALRAGRIDERKVDIVIEGTQNLPALQSRAVHRALLPAAEVITSAQLRKRVVTAAIAVDPELARKRHEEAKKTRTVSLNAADDGMAWLSAYLTAPEAMAAFTAIDALAAKTDADDDRPVNVRRADAFSQVFDETLNTGHSPGGCALVRRQGVRPHLLVTIAASTMAGHDDLPAQLAGYGPIGADVARGLATGAGPYSLVRTDPDTGAVTGLTRRAGTAAGPGRGTPAGPGGGAPAGPERGAGTGPERGAGTGPERGAGTGADNGASAAPGRGAAAKSGEEGATPEHNESASRPSTPAPPSGQNSFGQGVVVSAHDAAALIALLATAGRVDPVEYLHQMLGLIATDAYAPSARLRDLILTRDRTCRFPGCEQPGVRCQIDHITPFTPDLPAWAQTIETNLHLLCTHHHQLKTSGTWTVTRDVHGTTHWTAPSGHTYQRPAEAVDPRADLSDLIDAADDLAAELGEEAQHLRQDGMFDPGTAEDSHPSNLAGAALQEIQDRLMPGTGPSSTPDAARANQNGRAPARPVPGGARQPSQRPHAERPPPRTVPDAGKSTGASAGKSGEPTGGDDGDEPPF